MADSDARSIGYANHWQQQTHFASLAVLYMTPDSQYYRNSELSNRLHLAMRFLAYSQRADGTIDGYARGEIHATPTVAEAAHALFPSVPMAFSQGPTPCIASSD